MAKVGQIIEVNVKGVTKEEQIARMHPDSVKWLKIRQAAGLEGIDYAINRLKDIPPKIGKARVTRMIGKIIEYEMLEDGRYGTSTCPLI